MGKRIVNTTLAVEALIWAITVYRLSVEGHGDAAAFTFFMPLSVFITSFKVSPALGLVCLGVLIVLILVTFIPDRSEEYK